MMFLIVDTRSKIKFNFGDKQKGHRGKSLLGTQIVALQYQQISGSLSKHTKKQQVEDGEENYRTDNYDSYVEKFADTDERLE
jgi:hypothetical protein